MQVTWYSCRNSTLYWACQWIDDWWLMSQNGVWLSLSLHHRLPINLFLHPLCTLKGWYYYWSSVLHYRKKVVRIESESTGYICEFQKSTVFQSSLELFLKLFLILITTDAWVLLPVYDWFQYLFIKYFLFICLMWSFEECVCVIK